MVGHNYPLFPLNGKKKPLNILKMYANSAAMLAAGVDEAKVAQQTSDLLNALISEYGIMEGISRLLESLFSSH